MTGLSQDGPVGAARKYNASLVFFESHRWYLYETGQVSRLEV
jgi:hypothetical protein